MKITKTPAQLCKERNWKPGMLLKLNEEKGPFIIRLTAVGEEEILVRVLVSEGKLISRFQERQWDIWEKDKYEIATQEEYREVLDGV